MKKLKSILIVSVLATLVFFGCKKDPVEKNPAVAILGKWQCIAIGNGTEMIQITNNKSFTEYLADSVERIFENSTGRYQYMKYWIDSLLYTGQTTDDGITLITEKSRFRFSENNNVLELELTSPLVTFHNYTYRRIN